MHYLTELKHIWNVLASEDPLWAICGDPDKKGRKWELGKFFETGEQEIDAVFRYLEQQRVFVRREHALDFGCGVGRLTRALARYFSKSVGVDISEEMIRLAKFYNAPESHCTFIADDSPNLKSLNNNYFDFIYTSQTLQHIRPFYSRRYLRVLLQKLKPGGLLVFQVPTAILHQGREPTKRISYALRGLLKKITPPIILGLYRILRRKLFGIEDRIAMYYQSAEIWKALMEAAGGRMLGAKEDRLKAVTSTRVSDTQEIISTTFFVRKNERSSDD